MVRVIVLLDYSAAFDTVDHAVALDILERKFGVSSSCLQWHRSQLSGCTFSVTANCQASDVIDLESSVLQGSMLGPLLYPSCRQSPTETVWCFTASPTTLNLVSQCARKTSTQLKKQLDIQRWSNSHCLKLNAEKSKVICLGMRQQLVKLGQSDVTLFMGPLVKVSSSCQLWSGTLVCTLMNIYSLCQGMLLSPVMDPSTVSLCQLRYTL